MSEPPGARSLADRDGAEQSPRLRELLELPPQTARDMLEAEDAIDRLRDCLAGVDDPDTRGRLAATALERVEHQLTLVHERRRRLDRVEQSLWARRNRLERLLIGVRGSAWWHARRQLARQPPAG